MTTTAAPATPTVAISVSDSPDLALLGMAGRHLHRAMNGLATYLLSYGYHLAYGGDLRRDGFTEELFEIASRYDRQPTGAEPTPPVTDYLAWPVWTAIPRHELRELSDRLAGVARIVYLSRNGAELDRLHYPSSPAEPPLVASALTAMRVTMVHDADARIILGGRVAGYQGRMPGVAEEALISLQHHKPLYILGGFGGCARDIAYAMQLADPIAGTSPPSWDRLDDFTPFAEDANSELNNGLDTLENRTLAQTPYIQEAIALVLRGLERLARDA